MFGAETTADDTAAEEDATDETTDETTEEAWCRAPGWWGVKPLELDSVSKLIVLAAHPDDETLGAGGLISHLHAAGAEVQVCIVTDGEASHPDSPTLSVARMAELRRAESVNAVGMLAPGASVTFLGNPDRALTAAADLIRQQLAGLLDGIPREGLLVATTWAGDRHGDHRALSRAARDICSARGIRLIEFPIWMWDWAQPDSGDVPWSSMLSLRLTADERAAKRRAIAAHRTQTAPLSDQDGDEVMLRPAFIEHFVRDVEVFVDPLRAEQGSTSLDARFFDDFYRGKPDPWGFETRWYEERKRSIMLASLPRRRFRRALEVGCSTGVLTARLAERADELLALDISEAPLRVARERLRDHAGVSFTQLNAPEQWPSGTFDLIVLSEVGYYWSEPDLAAAIARIISSLETGGLLGACHWRYPVEGYPSDGDRVHAALTATPELTSLVRHLEDDFVLEIFGVAPARSVAHETGLVT